MISVHTVEGNQNTDEGRLFAFGIFIFGGNTVSQTVDAQTHKPISTYKAPLSDAKISVGKGMVIAIAAFVGWYCINVATWVIPGLLGSILHPPEILLYVVDFLGFGLALFFMCTPVVIIALFASGRSYSFYYWLAFGLLAVYVTNIVCWYAFYPQVAELAFAGLPCIALVN